MHPPSVNQDLGRRGDQNFAPAEGVEDMKLTCRTANHPEALTEKRWWRRKRRGGKQRADTLTERRKRWRMRKG